MVKVVERILRRLFPELFSGYHLPMFAKVVAISDAPDKPSIVNNFRPKFAVDVALLTANGDVDPKQPTYQAVPLPVAMAGLDQGMWGFPQPGTIVELAFAYGNPNKPFIRTILGSEATTPTVNNGDMVWQHSPKIHQTVDSAGSWTRTTDKSITDKSTNRIIESIDDMQTYLMSKIEVKTNSTEDVGGTKAINAMGAIRLTAAEQAMLISLKDLKLATNETLRMYSKLNTEINIDEQLQVIVKSIAHIETTEGKVWLGSGSINTIKVLLDLIKVVSDLANTLKTHTHLHGTPKTGPPVEASAIDGHKSSADSLHSDLEPITE